MPNNYKTRRQKIVVPRERSQTENPYVQTVPNKTCLCLDHPRWNVPMSRFSCVQKYLFVFCAFKGPYVQTFVRSKPSMHRLSCFQKCVCPDFRAFKTLCAQTFVLSKVRMSRLSCVYV